MEVNGIDIRQEWVSSLPSTVQYTKVGQYMLFPSLYIPNTDLWKEIKDFKEN